MFENFAWPLIDPSEIPRNKLVGIDFETVSLYDRTPIMVSFAWFSGRNGKTSSVVYDCRNITEKRKRAIFKFLDECHSLVAHNFSFELDVLNKWGYDTRKLFGKIEDSYIAIGVYNSESDKGLKENAYLVGMKLGTYDEASKASWLEFVEYCREDSICCLKLIDFMRPFMDDRKVGNAYEMEIRLIWEIVKIRDNGFYINVPYLGELKVEVENFLNEKYVELSTLAGRAINFKSSDQLIDVIYNEFGAIPNSDFMTPGGKSGIRKPGTNEAAINDLVKRYKETRIADFCETLLLHKEYSKFLSTYLSDKFMKFIGPDSRIRTNLNQLGTATSRMSSNDPNLLNIPKSGIGFNMRKAFRAAPGKMLLQIDYSQIEYRLIVDAMQDPKLIEAYIAGEDFHTATAKAMSVDRTLGKKLNFTLLYGGGVKRLAATMGISEDLAREYYNIYHGGLPYLSKLYDQLEAYAYMTGGMRLMSGRFRDFSYYIENKPYDVKRLAVNTLIQGNAGELIKTAMIRISDILPSDVKMLLQIYDELIFEGDEKILREIAPDIQDIMENTMKFSVPIVAEPKIIESWYAAKD